MPWPPGNRWRRPLNRIIAIDLIDYRISHQISRADFAQLLKIRLQDVGRIEIGKPVDWQVRDRCTIFHDRIAPPTA